MLPITGKILTALLLLFMVTPSVGSTQAIQITARELSGGERYTSSIYLSVRQYLSVRVDQEGIDVIVALHGPDGKLLALVNRPIGAHGSEFLHENAEASGWYTIEVRAANRTAQTGRYSLLISEPRPAQASDELLIAAQRALREGRSLRASGDKVQIGGAVKVFDSAARNFKTAGNLVSAADALIEQGQTVLPLGDAKTAETCFEEARILYRQAGDRHGEALALFRIGVAKPEGWQDYFRQTLAIARSIGNRFLEAKALREVGYDTGISGNYTEGIVLVRSALEMQRALGYRYDEAEALLSLGWMLNDLGDLQEGTAEYLKAARIHSEDSNRRELANALLFVSDGWLLLGDAERARDAVTESLEIARNGGYRLVEILALLKFSDVCLRQNQPLDALRQLEVALPLAEQANYRVLRVLKGLGQVRLAMGQYSQALDFLNRALALYQKQGAISGRADVNFYIAQAYARQGEFDRAQVEYERTLTDFKQRDERLGVARTLIAQARLQARQNNFDAAGERNGAALTLLESLRQGLANYSARTTFFATLAEAYALQIDLLMRPAPSRERVKAGFTVSERARARALLEMVNEARLPDVGQAATAQLGELHAAQQRLNEAALQRIVASPGSGPTDARLRELADEVEAARTRLRTAQPRYAALTQPQPLDVAAVQRLLDPDSLLLEFALGEEHSYLWAITPDQVTSHQLPKRAAIETAARTLHRLLEADKPHQQQAATLSRMLLSPVAAQLPNRRLLIVADGALQLIPFAILPQPQAVSRASQPLLTSHEITHLPSASVLGVLRQAPTSRQPALQTVAIFADPVFSREDARVKPRLDLPPEMFSETVRGGGSLQRLSSSSAEADRIRELAPPGTVLIAKGFEADRAALLQANLAPYRIVHFATHGLVDDVHPALSSLVLSLVDETGRPRDGFLRLHEIYNLKLNAELVVLSACRTGIGKEYKGEGLLSLTRGFMYAGTPRVVASLWQVNSVATSELMKRFYQRMLRDGLRPAAALRAAQLEIREQWPSPYYWGAFVLQGEWR
jgi:CHAT domain-containing protein